VHGTNGLVPLHHQKIISSFLEDLMRELSVKSDRYNFSSLKGTSKVQNGQIRFLSSKVSLVVSAPEPEFVQKLVDMLFDRRLINFAKLTLVPKSQQVIEDPDFQTVMKYVCISPLIPQQPFVAEENLPEPLNPGSHEFSDLIYDSIIERMERAGYSEKQLNQYAEFEVTPDAAYISKMAETQKKFARIYKNNQNQTMLGYLLPFTLHAHPDVHKFVWDSGIGLFTTHGYGMIDLVGRDQNDK
jgi:CRISPR-associated endoribonuclease Cas6